MPDQIESDNKTRDALHALGPKAVEKLEEALSQGGAVRTSEIEVAYQILDRIGFARKT